MLQEVLRTFTETLRHSLLLRPHLTFPPECPTIGLLFLTSVETTVKSKSSNKYSQYWTTLIVKLSSLRFWNAMLSYFLYLSGSFSLSSWTTSSFHSTQHCRISSSLIHLTTKYPIMLYQSIFNQPHALVSDILLILLYLIKSQ